ncbi:MAG: ABC transporter permease, partial [Flavobacteriaceae bacterium]
MKGVSLPRVALVPRLKPSGLVFWLGPVFAVIATMLVGTLVFAALGVNGFKAVETIFLEPVLNPWRWQDLGVKAAPMLIIACGLAYGFRANVWNIGAEGQYIAGAIAGTGVALYADGALPASPLPLMCLAGVLGGMAWAVLPALLRTRYRVNEILVTLMLTYVAIQLLLYLTRGPWRDPAGFNFPQTRLFEAAETMPIVVPGTVIHLGVPLAVVIALVMWVVMQRTTIGFSGRTVGLAPQAALYGGFHSSRVVWFSLLLSG